MNIQICEGCDDLQLGVKEYICTFDGDPTPVSVMYCLECAELAAMNWNGVTDSIEPTPFKPLDSPNHVLSSHHKEPLP